MWFSIESFEGFKLKYEWDVGLKIVSLSELAKNSIMNSLLSFSEYFTLQFKFPGYPEFKSSLNNESSKNFWFFES